MGNINARIVTQFRLAIPLSQLSIMCIYVYICRFNDITNGLFLLLSAKDPIFLLHMLTMTQHLLLTFHQTLAIEGTDLV